jgi:tetratricopeptide (TPR) repeat protein
MDPEMSPSTAARPVVFISYSHDSPEHEARVADLARKLAAQGLDCRIDQFQEAPPEGWPRWMVNQIMEAQFVLVVATETYCRRFEGKEGLGANWEGVIITQQLYEAATVNTRFVPVVFRREDAAHIPIVLRPSQYYDLSSEPAWRKLCERLGRSPAAHPLPAPPPVPGAFCVPYGRNPFFTGRQEALDRLRGGFDSGLSVQAVTGPGGIGKTELAVEFAFREREHYRAVLWAGAGTRDALVSGYAAIAGALDLPEKAAPEQGLIAAAAARWLERNSGWLLVLDHLAAPAAARDFLPRNPKGHILLTSRNPSLEELGVWEPIVLEALKPEDAIELLRRRARRVEFPAAEAEAARRLAMELECVPLALEQAAAYVRKLDTSFEDYLASYGVRGSRLLEGAIPERYARPASEAWTPNFSEIERTAPAAADLLRFSAFLSAEKIPLELPARGAPELGPAVREALARVASDPVALDEMLEPLAEFSLIRRDRATRTYNVQRLVQDAVLRSLPPEAERLWVERAVRALNRAFPVPDFPMWPYCERLLAHARACAAHVERLGLESPEAAQLLNQTALYLFHRARYSEFEPLQRRALEMWESCLGPDHPAVGMACVNLGSFYCAMGRLPQAEEFLLRAKAIADRSPGPDQALAENNLALLYFTEGRYSDAEPLFRRALESMEAALGAWDEHLALPLNNLGEICRVAGRYGEARPLYQRALEIWGRTRGESSPDAATVVNNLGLLERNQGHDAEAERLLKDALSRVDAAVGDRHPLSAKILNNLGDLYRAQQRFEEAEQALKRALGILEAAFGSEHADAGRTLGNLGLVYLMQDKLAVAEAILTTALEITEKALGPDHPDTAAAASNLGELYRRQRKPRQARPLLERALQITTAVKGAGHPDLILPLNNLALTYMAENAFTEAGRLFTRALVIADACFGADHPNAVPPLLNLATLRILDHQRLEAREFFREALGADNPRIDDWARKYAGQFERLQASAGELEAEWARQQASGTAGD